MHNCKKNSTTAKFYVGIIEEISTTAKKMAQLRNKMYNCKKKAQLRNTFIAVVHFVSVDVNPHMRIISLCVRGLPICKFFWMDSPYAYGDQFLMCQRSFLESHVESEYLHASQ